MKITDDNLIDHLRRKDEDALVFVIRKYGGILKTVINRVLYSYPQDSEECLYDSIMKIWDKIEFYDEQKSSFQNWAVSVAKYTALNRLRKITRLEPTVDIDDIPICDTSDITDNQLFNEFFMELISCLNDQDKELFIRIFWNGESIDDASRTLGKKKSNIYNRISRGRKKIVENNPVLFRRRNKFE